MKEHVGDAGDPPGVRAERTGGRSVRKRIVGRVSHPAEDVAAGIAAVGQPSSIQGVTRRTKASGPRAGVRGDDGRGLREVVRAGSVQLRLDLRDTDCSRMV